MSSVGLGDDNEAGVDPRKEFVLIARSSGSELSDSVGISSDSSSSVESKGLTREGGMATELRGVPPWFVRMSEMLSAACDFDRAETRLHAGGHGCEVDAEVLELLLRLAKLVYIHNLNRGTAPTIPIDSYVPDTTFSCRMPKSECLTLDTDWRNRARHLGLVIGGDLVIAQFLDQFSAEPCALFAMKASAERIGLRSVEIPCRLKFAQILDGLSIPQMEEIWPDDARARRASVRRVLAATADWDWREPSSSVVSVPPSVDVRAQKLPFEKKSRRKKRASGGTSKTVAQSQPIDSEAQLQPEAQSTPLSFRGSLNSTIAPLFDTLFASPAPPLPGY